jgi:hypothetical protein
MDTKIVSNSEFTRIYRKVFNKEFDRLLLLNVDGRYQLQLRKCYTAESKLPADIIYSNFFSTAERAKHLVGREIPR